ncbi:HAD family hydrolase [Methylotetracoccus oryzae]|uniref:HAD family hydrolase n=1 Tax=Methylotetracoccus oryzae TaxID=1919059 RepID=UPI00111A37E1|nr:HAD-IA family hydrolase [Methylotetracoccus oryzae]
MNTTDPSRAPSFSDRAVNDSLGRAYRGGALRPAAVICDLDGTLVDSGLDFRAIKTELGLGSEASVLEAIDAFPPEALARGHAVLYRHEMAGALQARLMPGVTEFLALIAALRLKCGLFTRNSRNATAITLQRCGLMFERVLTRDDGPVKPDPWAILELCRGWGIAPSQTLVFGDYYYDLAAGHAAGAVNVLVCQQRPPSAIRGYELAHFHLDSFADTEQVSRILSGTAGRMPQA